ncbi:MAG: hypothetical protein WC900_01210 [Oscillospiraceae bacterium]
MGISRNTIKTFCWRNALSDGEMEKPHDMLGYKQVNGVFTIIPEEAELVRQIFNDYFSGMGFTAIEKKLHSQG